MEIKIIEEKIVKGEKLTDEEKKEVMSVPISESSNKAPIVDDEEEGIKVIDEIKEKGEKKDALPLAEKEKEEVKKEEIKEPEKKAEAPIPEDVYKRLDIELAKPEGQANLSDFTEREKAFYFRMRREQRRAQKAEESLSTLQLEKLKDKASKEETKDEEEDPLKDRESEDFLTVGDIKKLMKSAQDKAKKQVGPNPEVEHYRNLYIAKCEERARDKHDDYNEVIELAEELISSDAGNLKRIQDVAMRGEDVAEAAYQLIKGDPKFETLLPVAQARLAAKGIAPKKQEEPKKEEPPAVSPEVKKVEEKLAEEKPKTSVHAGAAEGGERELTAEQVAKLTPSEWGRLNKATREKILRTWGV